MPRGWCSRWAIWHSSTSPRSELHLEVFDVSELLDDIAMRFTERATRQGVTIAAAPPGTA